MRNYSGLYIALEGVSRRTRNDLIDMLGPSLIHEHHNSNFVFAEERELHPTKSQFLTPIEDVFESVEGRQHIMKTVVLPALHEGKIVVSNGSVIESIAYHGGGRGLRIDDVWEFNQNFMKNALPDTVVLLRGGRKSDDFWTRVEDGYSEAIRWLRSENVRPDSKIVTIDITGKGNEEAHQELMASLAPIIKDWELNRETSIKNERE